LGISPFRASFFRNGRGPEGRVRDQASHAPLGEVRYIRSDTMLIHLLARSTWS
jgi:hypothetical protein